MYLLIKLVQLVLHSSPFCLLELPVGVRGSVTYCGEFTDLLFFPFPATFFVWCTFEALSLGSYTHTFRMVSASKWITSLIIGQQPLEFLVMICALRSTLSKVNFFPLTSFWVIFTGYVSFHRYQLGFGGRPQNHSSFVSWKKKKVYCQVGTTCIIFARDRGMTPKPLNC